MSSTFLTFGGFLTAAGRMASTEDAMHVEERRERTEELRGSWEGLPQVVVEQGWLSGMSNSTLFGYIIMRWHWMDLNMNPKVRAVKQTMLLEDWLLSGFFVLLPHMADELDFKGVLNPPLLYFPVFTSDRCNAFDIRKPRQGIDEQKARVWNCERKRAPINLLESDSTATLNIGLTSRFDVAIK